MATTDLKPKLVTAEEFADYEGDARYDLIRGELHPMPPQPGARHGYVTIKISSYATIYAEENDLGACFAAETRFTIEYDPDTSIGPDWAFVAKDRLPHPIPEKFLQLAPDIVLEVRSPTDRAKAVQEKIAQWLAAGVKIVWELDMKSQILTVYRPGREPRQLGSMDTLSGEEVLPGFTLSLASIFRDNF